MRSDQLLQLCNFLKPIITLTSDINQFKFYHQPKIKNHCKINCLYHKGNQFPFF